MRPSLKRSITRPPLVGALSCLLVALTLLSTACDADEPVDCIGIWEGHIWDHPDCPLVYEDAPDPIYTPTQKGSPLVTGAATVGGDYFADTIKPGTEATIYATHDDWQFHRKTYVELAAVSDSGVQTTIAFEFSNGLGSPSFAPGRIFQGDIDGLVHVLPIDVLARAGLHDGRWFAYDRPVYINKFKVFGVVGEDGMRTYSYHFALMDEKKMTAMSGTFQLIPAPYVVK